MKKITAVLVLVLFIFFVFAGCDQDVDVADPIIEVSDSEGLIQALSDSDIDIIKISSGEYSLLDYDIVLNDKEIIGSDDGEVVIFINDSIKIKERASVINLRVVQKNSYTAFFTTIDALEFMIKNLDLEMYQDLKIQDGIMIEKGDIEEDYIATKVTINGNNIEGGLYFNAPVDLENSKIKDNIFDGELRIFRGLLELLEEQGKEASDVEFFVQDIVNQNTFSD